MFYDLWNYLTFVSIKHSIKERSHYERVTWISDTRYQCNHPETFAGIVDDGKQLCSSVKDAAEDVTHLTSKVYSILGDPRQNWQTGMDGFVAAGRENGNLSPVVTVDNSRIYDLLNLEHLKNAGYEDMLSSR